MKRNIDLTDISDGKLYGANDLVKADCNDCRGCSDCCKGMGSSILLDPMDIYRFRKHLGIPFEEMMGKVLELNVVDGIILPNLKMSEETDGCTFLDEGGRCKIHAFRPGICRLFPLGRCYENQSFRYFLQVHECSNKNRTKVKVKKWLEIPDIKDYESYITDWHYFLNDCENLVSRSEEKVVKDLNLSLLNVFFVRPYNPEAEFYPQFYDRIQQARDWLTDQESDIQESVNEDI